MKNTDQNENGGLSMNPKKRRKPTKVTESITTPELPPVDSEVSHALANMLQNSIDKYAEVAEKQNRESREDFKSLEAVMTEFLDDYIIIGHTLDGQRVVIRYTATPGDLDKLTELCKKVLVRMMVQEQNGE